LLVSLLDSVLCHTSNRKCLAVQHQNMVGYPGHGGGVERLRHIRCFRIIFGAIQRQSKQRQSYRVSRDEFWGENRPGCIDLHPFLLRRCGAPINAADIAQTARWVHRVRKVKREVDEQEVSGRHIHAGRSSALAGSLPLDIIVFLGQRARERCGPLVGKRFGLFSGVLVAHSIGQHALLDSFLEDCNAAAETTAKDRGVCQCNAQDL